VNPHLTFFWVPAVLMLVAGALLLLLPGGPIDRLRKRNRRTAGLLMIAAGAAFAAVASGGLDRLL
jgi:drug/metabolite transporter (DMT)-like permease